MAATFQWGESNGTATGSPATGTSNFVGATDSNWKNIDDCTANSGSAYTAFPITAGNNSFTKNQWGKFSGTFGSISSVLWAHTAGTLGTGLTLKTVVTSTYTTPAASTNAALTTDSTSAISISSGAAVLLSSVGPQGASPGSSSTANPCYTQFLASQLQTLSSSSSGDTASVTLTLQYSET